MFGVQCLLQSIFLLLAGEKERKEHRNDQNKHFSSISRHDRARGEENLSEENANVV